MLALAACIVACLSQVSGQSSMESTEGLRNNFAHPPGTATAKLGRLGEVKKLGHGPVDLILIPGASFDQTIWESFARRNEEQHTMYAVTPAGYGGTAPPPMPEPEGRFEERTWTEGMLEAIVRLIDREKLNRPIVVGHHLMGDYYAMRLALDHPQKIGGVIVIAGDPSRQVQASDGSSLASSLPERVRLVHEDPAQAPFYKTVDDETWEANVYKAESFCRDTERGLELYEQQLGNPKPTQLRYYLEYLTDDLTERLADLKVPLLVVDPVRKGFAFDGTEEGFDAVLDRNVEANMGQFEGLSREEVKSAMRAQILERFGSIEAFAEVVSKNARPWDPIVQANPLIKLEELSDTGIFVMEDQPKRLDELIAAFAAESVGQRQSKN